MTLLAIEWTVALSMAADISSGPFALVVSRESNSSSTSFSLQRSSGGHSDEALFANVSLSVSESGGIYAVAETGGEIVIQHGCLVTIICS